MSVNFNIIVAVWGESYIDCLRHILLPSLAVPGGLESLGKELNWKFLVYTSTDHVETAQQSINRYFSAAEIVVTQFRPQDFDSRYLAMAHAHHLGAIASIADAANAIFVAPDAVFSEGALSYVVKAAKNGKKALMAVGPRLRQDTAFATLRERLSASGQIPSRELVAVLQNHPHPELSRYKWDSPNFSSRPFMLVWDTPTGYLCRNFHLHPLMIDFSAPVTTAVLRRDGIDGEFIGEAISVWDDIQIVQDSDDLLICTLTPVGVFYSDENRVAASASEVRRTAYNDPIVNPVHRWFLTKAIKLHTDDLDATWRELEEETGRIVYEILETRSRSGPVEAHDLNIADPIEPAGEDAQSRHCSVESSDGLNFSTAIKATNPKRGISKYSVGVRVIEGLSRLLDVRVVRPGLPHRIGHLVMDFESYIKERLTAGKTRKPIYIIDDRQPCNQCMLDYWRKYIHVIEGPLARLLRGLTTYAPIADNLEHRYAYTLEGASSCFPIEAEWGDRGPLFQLESDHARRGEACLAELGLPAGAWFVCVHARGGGYSPSDEAYHSYRNVDISSYFMAMDEIVRRGGWCIRVGDETMDPLAPRKQTIDYARSPFKSDWMDVFLCARCRFFLGSSSGLFLVSSAFGVPSALTNIAPISCSLSYHANDVSIPKLVLGSDGMPMPFAHLFSSGIADMRFTELFEAAGVTHESNSAEEIYDLVCEMLDTIGGIYSRTNEDEERQQKFKGLFNRNNYSYGSKARLGDAFLRRHRSLLPS